MRRNMKELGNDLEDVCFYGNEVWTNKVDTTVIEGICAALTMNIIDFEDKAAKCCTVEFMAEVTGYTKKEVHG